MELLTQNFKRFYRLEVLTNTVIILKKGVHVKCFLTNFAKFCEIYLSIYLSICLSVCLSIYLFIYLSICLFIYLSIYLSIYLCSYVSIHLYIYIYIYIYLYIGIKNLHFDFYKCSTYWQMILFLMYHNVPSW